MRKDKITQNQYIFIVIASMIGIGVLSLPSDVCRIAHQQGWISTFIGGVYPVFIVLTASIIDKKTNHASFWEINNKTYGKTLSYIFTLIFFLYFLTSFAAILAGFTNVLRETITSFLYPIYIILPILVLISLISMGGIYMVGRLCEFYFYLTLPIIFIPLFFITKGSIVNVQPVFSSSNEIIKATTASSFSFAGCEISYFIISHISNRKSTMKAGMIASTITVGIYTLIAFITIYFLGWELTSKFKYPLAYIVQAIPIPIISNLTAVFLFIWSVIILRTLLTESFITSLLLSKLIKIDYEKANVAFLPIALIYALFIVPEQNKEILLSKVIPSFVIFSVAWGLITTILVSIRFRGEKK